MCVRVRVRVCVCVCVCESVKVSSVLVKSMYPISTSMFLASVCGREFMLCLDGVEQLFKGQQITLKPLLSLTIQRCVMGIYSVQH